MKRLVHIFIASITIVMLSGWLTGCRSIRDVQHVYTHDTMTIYQRQLDSIYLHDSIYMERIINGDTIREYKYVFIDRWKERIKHDSIYINRTDTIFTEKIIEKQLSGWQKFKIAIANALFIFVFLLVVYGIVCRPKQQF